MATPAQSDPDRLVSPAELAERWSVTRATVYNLMKRGLPSVKIGKSRRIRLRDADAWVEEVNGDAS